MKIDRFLHCFLITALLLTTGSFLVSCENKPSLSPSPTPTPSPTEEPGADAEERPKAAGALLPETREINLNGTWKFYQDTKAVTRTCTVAADAVLPLEKESGTSPVEIFLNVSKPTEMLYAKLTLTLEFDKDDLPRGKGSAPGVYITVNGKNRHFTAFDGDLPNAVTTSHRVDVSMCYTDLTEGENAIGIATNFASGRVTVKEVTLTAYPTLMFGAREMTVPGAWELQLSDTNAYTAYDGVGWYERSFDYPYEQDDPRTRLLTFSGIDYYAEIWINDCFILSHENGYTPIVIDLADYVGILCKTGNRLTVRVTDQSTAKDAAFPLKQTLAGFYHDTVGVNYGGIWGDVYMTDCYRMRAENMTVSADIRTEQVKITAEILRYPSAEMIDSVTFSVFDADGNLLGTAEVPFDASLSDGSTDSVTATVDISGNAKPWSADSPVLYSARVTVGENATATTFGFAAVSEKESAILLNDAPIQLNGVLFWLGNWEQLTPRYEPEAFRTQIRQLKAYGFNAVKFCLVVPPDYLLDICDSEGIYVYIEYPMWMPNQTDAFYERCYTQIPDMVRMARNHPCVICSDFNCEMGGFTDDMKVLMRWCVETGKALDANRLYADNSTTGEQGGDYNEFWTWHPYVDALNFADYGNMVSTLRNAKGTLPLVFGEYADYPALSDFSKFVGEDGSTPWNWTVCDDPFRADIFYTKLGFSTEQIANLVSASEANCVEMKMHIVQETKKVKGLSAYFLTIMQDIGHSVAGFFDETGAVKYTPAQTQFVKETVLLWDKTVYNYLSGSTVSLTPALSHYGEDELTDGTLSVTLTDENGTVLTEEILAENLTIPRGNYTTLQPISFTVPSVAVFTPCTLKLTLTGCDYSYSNDWQVTLYADDYLSREALNGKTVAVSGAPKDFGERYPFAVTWKNGATPDVLVVFDSLSAAQLSYLRAGGKVLYFGTGSEAVEVTKGTYYSQYVLLDFPLADHPAVRDLAKQGYGGTRFLTLQTQYVITEKSDEPLTHSLIGKVLLRDNVPDAVATGSYLSEFSVGKGTLMQCTLDMKNGDAPLCNYLLDRTLSYLLNK